ncbi:MAG: hydrogenase maturation protease [candidate division WS1 bacterium]|nr:hydrogenase maturation protease [candidate division WS1 bacterium]
MSQATPVPETLVLGVGNDLMRDDGAGSEAARRLQEEDLGPGVEVIVGGVEGLDLIFELEGRTRAILLDAAHMGLTPGDVRVVRREEIEDRLVPLTSLHQLALHDVLELAELTGLQAEVTLVAVEPAEVLPGMGLTPAVQAAVPEMIRLAKELLRRGGS